MSMKSYELNGARVEVCSDLAQLSARAAELFVDLAHLSVNAQEAWTVALSGGSTPMALYALLASETFSPLIPWSKTHLYWSDERCVPPDNPQSNYRMARETLLDHVPVPASQIYRLHGEDEPARAAADYAALLEQNFGTGRPRFDLILLGMGNDGHTASLFPHSPALDETARLVAAPYVEKFGAYRLTLTLRVLNAASNIIFLVSGSSKAAALRAVLKNEVDAQGDIAVHDWPARLVRPEAGGNLIWLVDEPAFEMMSDENEKP